VPPCRQGGTSASGGPGGAGFERVTVHVRVSARVADLVDDGGHRRSDDLPVDYGVDGGGVGPVAAVVGLVQTLAMLSNYLRVEAEDWYQARQLAWVERGLAPRLLWDWRMP
jgi:hypothetical protein